MSNSITLHIDTLALPGLSPMDAQRAARAFEEELTRLLHDHGLPSGTRPRDLERIDLGALKVDTGTPDAMGRALARALLRRLG